jgi:hypothetical protein
VRRLWFGVVDDEEVRGSSTYSGMQPKVFVSLRVTCTFISKNWGVPVSFKYP